MAVFQGYILKVHVSFLMSFIWFDFPLREICLDVCDLSEDNQSGEIKKQGESEVINELVNWHLK